MSDISTELALAKAAAKEWRARLQYSETRVAAVWNEALHEARTRIGHHVPKCIGTCVKCWAFDELGSMRRGDTNNYVPIKERLRKRAGELSLAWPKTAMDRNAYIKGINDLLEVAEGMLGDGE